MKKFLRGVFTFLLIICIGLLFLNLHLKSMINDIIKETMKSEISTPITSILKNHKLIDNNIKNEQITDIILNDEDVNKLYDQYSTTIINGIMDEKELDKIDLNATINNLIKNNQEKIQEKLNITITDEQIKKFSDEVTKTDGMKEQVKNTIKNIKKQLSSEEQSLIKIYYYVTSNNFKIIISTLIGIVILAIALLYPSIYRPLFNVGLSTTITSILCFIFIPIFKSIVDYYFQEQLNILTVVNAQKSISHTFWMLGIGIFLLLLYYIINYFIKEKKNRETN